MRILIISAGYPPYVSGVATATANLVTQLSQRHQITLISSTTKRRPLHLTPSPNIDHYLLPGISLKKISDLAIPFPHQGKIETIINTFNPDVIHLQDPSPPSLVALYLANQFHIPTVITHHFTPEFIVKSIIPGKKISYRLSQNITTKQIIYRLVNTIYNRCSLLTIPNPAFIPDFKTAKLRIPIIPIPNGIISKNFTYKQKLSTVLKTHHILQPQILLYVGRLDLDKNLNLLIEAFQSIHQLNPHTSLVLIGDGTQKKRLVKQIKKLALNHSVYFLGTISNHHKQLSYLYNAAYLFANPSVIENHSVSSLEALTAGLPIIAARCPGQSHLIKPPQSGLLFEPNNPISLAACLQKLLSQPKLAKSISSYNKKLAKQYNVSLTSQQYLKAYQSLL